MVTGIFLVFTAMLTGLIGILDMQVKNCSFLHALRLMLSKEENMSVSLHIFFWALALVWAIGADCRYYLAKRGSKSSPGSG